MRPPSRLARLINARRERIALDCAGGGSDEKLKEVCERIIDLKDDGTLQIILLKAQAYLEIGKKKEAFKFVDKAIKLNPYDPFPYLMKGILYNKLEMFDEANECFVEAFRLNPELLNMMDELS